jgi:hypothetical protein
MNRDILSDPRYIAGAMSEAETCAAAAEFQERADSALQLFGQRAPGIQAGETLAAYRRRLLKNLQPKCEPPFREVNLCAVADSQLQHFEARMIDGTIVEFKKPIGPLREAIEIDRSGRRISKFYGDNEYVWGPFKGPTQRFISAWDTDAYKGINAAGAVKAISHNMSDGSVRPAT